MMPVPNGAKVWLALGHTDMRRGMRSLALQVQQALNKDVHAGDLYVFREKNGSLCKILWHAGLGMSLYAKRRQLEHQKGGVPLVSPLAKEALEWINQIFAIEREINGLTAGERLNVRQERVAPLIQALETRMREKRGMLSRYDAVAKAIVYLLNG